MCIAQCINNGKIRFMLILATLAVWLGDFHQKTQHLKKYAAYDFEGDCLKINGFLMLSFHKNCWIKTLCCWNLHFFEVVHLYVSHRENTRSFLGHAKVVEAVGTNQYSGRVALLFCETNQGWVFPLDSLEVRRTSLPLIRPVNSRILPSNFTISYLIMIG